MSQSPQQSLPKQCPDWADLKAAYRLLSNGAVDARAIQEPHRRHVRDACAGHPVVLCVQDTSDLDFTRRTGISGLGKTGNGSGRGLLQHTALAVLPGGRVLGVLDQTWHARVERPEKETRKQRLARWRESSVWADAVAAVGPAPSGCRFVHVGDRHSDCRGTMDQCDRQGAGFVLRAMHDRRVVHEAHERLWELMGALPVAGTADVSVGTQRNGYNRVKRPTRDAKLAVRFARVTLDRPAHTPKSTPGRSVFVVYASEIDPPAGQEPLEWMLLTSEPVESLADALRVLGWYADRWVVEEFHRAEKEGCRLEATQLDDSADVARLASIVAVVAVRLLQLRDSARRAQDDPAQDAPHALRSSVPRSWILVVAKLAGVATHDLTPTQFYRTIAKRGGHLGRKGDGPPGWKTLWRGWQDISLMVAGVELALGNDAGRRSG